MSAPGNSASSLVRLQCPTRGMAAWLLRAIVMENIAVRADGTTLELPAAPSYRLHKEVKNVITVIAKTAHYWVGHMSVAHRQTIADPAGVASPSPVGGPSSPISCTPLYTCHATTGAAGRSASEIHCFDQRRRGKIDANAKSSGPAAALFA